MHYTCVYTKASLGKNRNDKDMKSEEIYLLWMDKGMSRFHEIQH